MKGVTRMANHPEGVTSRLSAGDQAARERAERLAGAIACGWFELELWGFLQNKQSDSVTARALSILAAAHDGDGTLQRAFETVAAVSPEEALTFAARAGDDSAAEVIGRHVGRYDVDTRLAAVEALRGLGGGRAHEILMALTKDRHESVRANAVRALAGVTDPRVERLLFSLRKELRGSMPGAMVHTLGRLQSDTVLPALAKLLAEGIREDRIWAVRILGQREGEDVSKLLSDTLTTDNDEAVRAEAVYQMRLKHVSEPVVRALIRAIGDESLEVRCTAMCWLARIGCQEAVGPLRRASRNPDARVRGGAIAALARIGATRAADLLAQALDHPNTNVLDEVLWILTRTRGVSREKCIELLPRLARDQDWRKRQIAAKLAPYLLYHGAMDLLVGMLGDEHSDVRMTAVRSLNEARFGGEPVRAARASRALMSALTDPEPDVRGAVVEALASPRDTETRRVLVSALQDSDHRVRKEAAASLAKIYDPEAVRPLIPALKDEHHEVRAKAAESLGRLKGEQTIDPLIEALKDAQPAVRKAAARALGDAGDRKATLPLVRMLREDPDCEPRCGAVWALGQLKDERALESLIEATSMGSDILLLNYAHRILADLLPFVFRPGLSPRVLDTVRSECKEVLVDWVQTGLVQLEAVVELARAKGVAYFHLQDIAGKCGRRLVPWEQEAMLAKQRRRRNGSSKAGRQLR